MLFVWLRVFAQCSGGTIMPKDVLKNMDNEVEFVGVFRPPKRSTKETIKLFLYNSEKGTVLGRTGVSWGKDSLCSCHGQYLCMIFVSRLLNLLNCFEECV